MDACLTATQPALPREIWNDVFLHKDLLDPYVLFRIMMTSKVWAELIITFISEVTLDTDTPQERVLKKLVAMGAKLTSLHNVQVVDTYADTIAWQITTLTSLQVADKFDQSCAPRLAKLLNLQTLNLGWTKSNDSDVAHLSSLSRLTMLSLCGNTKVTNVGLASLNGPNMQKISLYNIGIGPGAIQIIADRFPNLQHAGMRSTLHSHPAEFERLSLLTSLYRLSVQNTFITDSGMASLCTLTRLTHLSALTTDQTDRTIDMMKSLTNLKVLKISYRGTSSHYTGLCSLPSLVNLRIEHFDNWDAFLHRVGRLSSLTKLHLDGGDLSDEKLMYLSDLKCLESLEIGNRSGSASCDTFRSVFRALPALKSARITASDQPTELSYRSLAEEFPGVNIAIRIREIEVDYEEPDFY